ncbi:uncharacterized protein [Diadema antillarum]|uniref:uncharacterized protein n=1 Tax=Diadema antillarum TaxID=105358 RepID=UPI003A84EB6C
MAKDLKMATVQEPMPPNHSQLPAKTEGNVVKRLQLLSQITLGGAAVLLLFGVFAILLWTYYSFYATPISTAVVIYTPTGILGLVSAKGRKRSPTLAFLMLSVLCCMTSVMLIGLHIAAAANEEEWNSNPARGLSWSGCTKGARLTISIFIILVAVFLLLVNVLSLVCGVIFAHIMTSTTGDALPQWVEQIYGCISSSHCSGYFMSKQHIMQHDEKTNARVSSIKKVQQKATIKVPTIPHSFPSLAKAEDSTIKGIMELSKMILCNSALLVIFGVVAILMFSYYSYYATPIWTAVMIYTPTAIMGFVSVKGKKRSAIITFLMLSVLCCMTSLMLVGFYIAASVNETSKCRPSAEFRPEQCATQEARQAIDIFIVIAGTFSLLFNMLSIMCGVKFARTTTTTGDACALWFKEVFCCNTPSHDDTVRTITGEQQLLRYDEGMHAQANAYSILPVYFDGSHTVPSTKQANQTIEPPPAYTAGIKSEGQTVERTEPIRQPAISFVYTNLEAPSSPI